MGLEKHPTDMNGSNLGLAAHQASRSVIDWDDDDGKTKEPGLCCLQGCLAGSAVGCSFFVALPTGIILIVLASNNDDTALLSVGIVLVVLPVIVLLVVTGLCINQNKLPCQTRKRKRKKSPTKFGQINPAVTSTESSGEFPV